LKEFGYVTTRMFFWKTILQTKGLSTFTRHQHSMCFFALRTLHFLNSE